MRKATIQWHKLHHHRHSALSPYVHHTPHWTGHDDRIGWMHDSHPDGQEFESRRSQTDNWINWDLCPFSLALGIKMGQSSHLRKVMYIHVYSYIYSCTFVYIRVCSCIFMFIFIYIFMTIYVYSYTFIYIPTYSCIFMYIHLYSRILVYIHNHICL